MFCAKGQKVHLSLSPLSFYISLSLLPLFVSLSLSPLLQDLLTAEMRPNAQKFASILLQIKSVFDSSEKKAAMEVNVSIANEKGKKEKKRK
jgi:hypothetical protein